MKPQPSVIDPIIANKLWFVVFISRTDVYSKALLSPINALDGFYNDHNDNLKLYCFFKLFEIRVTFRFYWVQMLPRSNGVSPPNTSFLWAFV